MIQENNLIDIYKNYSKELLVYVFRLTGSNETAEDILHDTFINLIKYSNKHHVEKKTVRAFLYKTAHNLSVNHLKRKGKIEFSSLETSRDFTSGDSVSSDIERKELNDKIYELLNRLDNETRSVFIMKKELGLSISEIAGNTGKSERTVLRKIKRAVAFLAEEMKKGGFSLLVLLFSALFYYLIVI